MKAAEINKLLKAKVEDVRETAKKGLDFGVMEVFNLSKNKYCPVDTGALKVSGKNEVSINTKKKYRRTITYGGSTSIQFVYYEVIVHEVPYNHFNPPTATWKYLDRAVKDVQPKFDDYIKAFVRRVL